MKILLVSQSILPYKGGSSIIIENLASHFTKEEMLVLGARKLNHPQDFSRSAKDESKFKYFFSELSIFGRGARFFDWFRRLRYKALKTFIRKTIEEENINYIIGVYPNSFYCLAACEVAIESGIPFSSYFHNTYVENTAINERNAEAIQQKIFNHSRHIFVMSEGMKSFYEEKYQLNKFVSLLHTYSEESTHYGQKFKKKDQYQMVALGNFNESNIDATSRFVQAISGDQRFKLNIYTQVPKVLLQQRGVDVNAINYKGFLHPDKVVSELAKYDICVLTHGFTGGYGEIEYRTIFPTRTIPMLVSGNPIIAHSPPNSFLSKFIRDNECAALVDVKSEKEIISTLERIVSDKEFRDRIIAGASRTKEQFYGPKVASFLKQKLAL